MTKNAFNVHFFKFIFHLKSCKKNFFENFISLLKYSIKVIIANKHISLSTLKLQKNAFNKYKM